MRSIAQTTPKVPTLSTTCSRRSANTSKPITPSYNSKRPSKAWAKPTQRSTLPSLKKATTQSKRLPLSNSRRRNIARRKKIFPTIWTAFKKTLPSRRRSSATSSFSTHVCKTATPTRWQLPPTKYKTSTSVADRWQQPTRCSPRSRYCFPSRV